MGSITLLDCGEDWISRVPDGVISHILSFLPTKYAVRTSVLSKRWKYLWTSITNLDLDVGKLLVTEDEIDVSSFVLFVDRVLKFCKSAQIQRFRLCCPIEVDLHTLALWVSEGIKRGPVELDLRLYHLELPRCLFTCNSLVILKLGCGIRCPIEIPPSFCFPCLKILHIDFYFPPKQLMQCLFRSCPVLEDLVIIGELGEEQGLIFDISAPALKRLKVQL